MKLSDFYVPTERQRQAHKDSALYLGYGGAVGGGKSVFLCADAWLSCVRQPGNRIFMGRKVARHFRETTLQTWIKLIPPQAYKINESRSEIKVFTGAEPSIIQYGGLLTREELSRWLSAEYGAIYFDQAEELDDSDFSTCLSRLRLKLPSGTHPLYRGVFTANPKNCAFKNLFINSPGKDFHFIPAKFSDNPHLDSGYIPRLRELYKSRPEIMMALIEGDWNILEGADVMISSAWVDRAAEKISGYVHVNKIGICADIARFGDDESVVYGLVGSRVVQSDVFSHMDVVSQAGRILKMAREINATWIIVDGIGVGAGVIDNLRSMVGDDIQIIDFQSAAKADNAELFYNKRAQAWWEVSNIFREGWVGIPNDGELKRELSAVTYSYSGGRILVENKEEIKRKLGRSPDRADALIMGLYYLPYAPDKAMGLMEKLRVERAEKMREAAMREAWLDESIVGGYQSQEIDIHQK